MGADMFPMPPGHTASAAAGAAGAGDVVPGGVPSAAPSQDSLDAIIKPESPPRVPTPRTPTDGLDMPGFSAPPAQPAQPSQPSQPDAAASEGVTVFAGSVVGGSVVGGTAVQPPAPAAAPSSAKPYTPSSGWDRPPSARPKPSSHRRNLPDNVKDAIELCFFAIAALEAQDNDLAKDRLVSALAGIQ